MESKSSLPFSRELGIEPYRRPVESSPHRGTLFSIIFPSVRPSVILRY